MADDVEASAVDEEDSPWSCSKLKLMARFKSSSVVLASGTIVGNSWPCWLLCKLCRMALFRASWSSPSSISFQLMASAAFSCSSSSSGSCFLVGAFLKWRGERGAKLKTLSASQLGKSPTTMKMEYLSVCSWARKRERYVSERSSGPDRMELRLNHWLPSLRMENQWSLKWQMKAFSFLERNHE